MANHSFELSAILPIKAIEKGHKIQLEKYILLILTWKWSEYFICKLFKTIYQAWQILA